jgi:4-aminobutyrate aminotransferase
MKLARYVTGRHRFIAFTGSFHGRTFGSLSLTASKTVQRKGFGPLLPGVTHVPYAYCYRCPFGKSSENCCLECLALLEHLFRSSVPPEEVAAVFVEPIQGEGGYVVPPAEFLQGLEKICRKYGILLVADEVQCGMGRTGKWWASEHFGIEPDILCVAKGIASGMPLGAMIAPADLMRWAPGSHATTFGGNPVCIAAALATIRLIETEYLENARQMGHRLMTLLGDWPQRFPVVGEVRGKGLMIGIEMVRDQKTREMAPELRDAIVGKAFERGLLVLGCGPSTFRLMPPLVIDHEQVEFAVKSLEGIITEIAGRA